MKVVAVPNELHDAIHKRIIDKLAGRPIKDDERELVYSQLLEYFDRTGVIPDFELQKLEKERDE